MRLYKVIPLFLLISCGKVKHEVTPIQVQAPTELTIYQSVAIDKMWAQLISICQSTYSLKSIEYAQCMERSQDVIFDLIENFSRTNLEQGAVK